MIKRLDISPAELIKLFDGLRKRYKMKDIAEYCGICYMSVYRYSVGKCIPGKGTLTLLKQMRDK